MGNKHTGKYKVAEAQEDDTATEDDVKEEANNQLVSSHQQEPEEADTSTEESSSNKSSDDEIDSHEEPVHSPPVSYYLKLYCSTDPTKSRNVTVVVPHTPKTVQDVKLHVQKEFSIPTCCMYITFESQQLKDHYSISDLRIREGDTLVINYSTEAMVEEVGDIINAMREMISLLRSETTRKQLLSNVREYDRDISDNLYPRQVELLASRYFHPSSNDKCKANRLFFVSNNGLVEMHQLHEELLKYPWKNCLLQMQHLEHAILRVLWNISAAFSIRMLLFQRPTLEAVMKSLVRVEMPADRLIVGPRGNYESRRITCEMLYKAVGTIGNLAEIPDCRVKIASRKDVLDQLLATLTCPSYNYIASLVAAAGILCLAYSSETHQYLTTDNVIDKFDKACKARKHHSLMDEHLLKYFRSMFYAQLLYASASEIPLERIGKMRFALEEFLEIADFENIREHERKNGYIWSTVTPFVKLVYLPKQSPNWSFCSPMYTDQTNREMRELEELCIEAGVFSLQNMLLSNDTRELLVTESLLDYVVCMPWHLSKESNAYHRACDLKDFLSTKMQIQPPSLVNMAKAKLAVTHCGLDKVLKATSLHEIVNEIGH